MILQRKNRQSARNCKNANRQNYFSKGRSNLEILLNVAVVAGLYNLRACKEGGIIDHEAIFIDGNVGFKIVGNIFVMVFFPGNAFVELIHGSYLLLQQVKVDNPDMFCFPGM